MVLLVAKIYFVFCWLSSTGITFVTTNPTEGDVRLTDGGAPNQGRIEIYFNNTWWRLCSHHFHGQAFDTVCRKLDLPAKTRDYRDAQFGAGNLSFLHIQFSCDQVESSLLNCRREEWHGGHCNAENTVGVVCGEMVFAECSNGGDKTDISSQLVFARGPRAHEIQCEWKIHNTRGDHVVLNFLRYREDHCGTPEIEVRKGTGEGVQHRHNCQNMDYGAILWEIPSSNVTVRVRNWEDANSPPFFGSYVIVDGGLKSASVLIVWSPTIINVTDNSFVVQWPLLTNEINQPVQAYIVVVNWTTEKYPKITGRILPSNATSVTIRRMPSFVDYQVVVIAVDGLGRPHNSSLVSVRTLEGVPRSAPWFEDFKIVPHGHVQIFWHPIAAEDRNGVILGYAVYFETDCKGREDPLWQSGAVNVSAPNNNYTLTDLRPGLRYRVRIAGFTSKGTSEHYSEKTVWSACAGQGTLTGDNGTIVTPSHPCEYGGRQHCHWHISPNASSSTKAIWVKFTDFNLAEHHEHGNIYCWFHDLVGISTVESENGTLLCRHMGDFSLFIPNNQVHVRFFTRWQHERSGHGFKALYHVLPDKLAEIQLSSWALSVNVTQTSADLLWTAFPLNISINHFTVKYTEVKTGVSVFLPLQNRDSRSFHIDNGLRPGRMYFFQIIAFTGGIENDTYSSVNISKTTKEGAPIEGPGNVIVKQSIFDGHSIVVRWDPLDEKYTIGHLEGYTVYYREQNYHHRPDYDHRYEYLGKSINTSSSDTQVVIRNLDGGKMYEISIAAFTVHLGPRSEWRWIMVGCGGRNFSERFGSFDLVKYDWGHVYCSWTISNVGLSDAVLLVSAHRVELRSCSEWTKIFSSNGTELFHYSRCEGHNHDYSIGELVEVPFGGSSYLTAKVKLEHEGTVVRSEFAILKAGKSLHGALDTQSPWYINGQTSSGTSLIVDWSGFPNSLDAAFFIISLNQTMPDTHGDSHYDDRGPRVFLHMVHSNHTSAEVKGLPMFTKFTATVYLVDTANEIYKSQTAEVETGEGFPTHPPTSFHYEFLSADSVQLWWDTIPPEHHHGSLLGYTLWYRAGCREAYTSAEVRINTSLSQKSYTLTGLLAATKYNLWIAGFTAAGIGQEEHREIYTSCGVPRTFTDNNGTIQSPGYPCGYGGIQNCRWYIRPSGPTTAIWIKFEDFGLSFDHGNPFCCSNDRVGISTEASQDEVFLCDNIHDLIFLVLRNQVDISFSATKDRHGHGFKASYVSVQDVFTETSLSSWTMSYENVQSSSVEIRWTQFPRSMDSVQSMSLMITEPNKDMYAFIRVDKWESSRHIENLSPNKEYIFKVMAFTGDHPDNVTYSSQNISVKIHPGAPCNPPPNIRLETVQSSNLLVQWDPLLPEYHNGQLQEYKVYYKRRHHHESENAVSTGVSETHVVIIGLQVMKEYEISVAAVTSSEGPRSEWQSITIGCGGSFNQSFGMVNLQKFDWEDRTCSWKIYSFGLNKAVLLISVQELRFHSCGHEYVRVFSDDQEFARHQDCSHVRGEIVVAPFGASNQITSEIRIQNMESYMRTQFVVLKGGLDSAVDRSSSWGISLTDKSEASIKLDWSGYPGDLNAFFFVISLNQTKINQMSEHHDPHNEYQNKPMRILNIANSSQTTAVISDIPASTEFVAIVYLVDTNNNIYKSRTLLIETEESVPTQAPHAHDWNFNLAGHSVWFRIHPLEERYHGGELLGYKITYYQRGREDDKRVTEIDVNTTTVTLNNLVEGVTYLIFVSGFTSKGVGPNRTFAISLCGGEIQQLMGHFSSPDYPGTPYIPPDQYEDLPRCHWKIRPQDPNVTVIWLTFRNFFLGRREGGGHCSGGVEVYIPGEHEHDKRSRIDICGKETNYSIVIMDKNSDIEARGFGYHRHEEEYRRNNGTKFIVDFKALPEESVIGTLLGSWTGVHLNVSNSSALITWPEPPSSFLNGATVEKYLIIGGKDPTQIFNPLWLPAVPTQYELTGLQARTNYIGKIIAVLSDGRRGSTDWIRFQTKEGIPSMNPYIFERMSIDYSTIWIRWHKLDEHQTGGTIVGYRIYIKQEDHHDNSQPLYREITVGPDVLEYNITGLPAETSFRVWVGAFTAVGEGVQRHDQWIRTKCGSTFNRTSGDLQSRGYPERMEYSDCIWYINSRNKSVFLWVEHYDIPDSHECNEAYVAVGDDSGVPPHRVCGMSGQAAFIVQARRVPLIYYSQREFYGSKKGFELKYYVLNESVSEALLVANWNILNISNAGIKTVSVEWSHYSPDPPYSLGFYGVVCTPTHGKPGPTIFNVDKANDRADVDRLRPGTNYTVQVVAFIYINGTETFSLRRSHKAYAETIEGVPLDAPEDVQTETFINNTLYIRVKWRPIPSDKVEGTLMGYKVFFRTSDNEFSIKVVGPDVLETNIDIVNDPQPYEIRVAAFTRGGVGPLSWPRETQGCQATVFSKMGVITSPGYPSSTPGGLNCYYAFYPDFQLSQIQRFRLVHVVDVLYSRKDEGAPNCTYWRDDYVGWARINPTRILAGPFCGRVNPFAFVSWGDKIDPIYIGFFTGLGPHQRGFNSTFFALHDFSKISLSVTPASIKGYEVQLTWSVSGLNEQIQGYVVLYKPTKGQGAVWSFTRKKQSQTTLVPLQPLTNYTAWVLGHTASGDVFGSNTIHFVTTGELPTIPAGFTPTTPPVIRMYPYGSAVGDTLLTFVDKCIRINIPGGGLRFFERRFRKLFICPNGVIQFHKDRWNQRPYNFGQRYWLRYSSMLAPYWTRTSLRRSFVNGPSKVFYHIYTGPGATQTLREATSDALSVLSASLPEGKTFNATWMSVVTWVKLRHFELNPITETLTNTFQAIIITDNIFSFVMFNYPHNGIQFSAPTSVSNYEYFNNYVGLPVIGYNSGGKENHFRNMLRSGTVRAESIDNLPGNANIPGRWIMRIENSNGIEDSDFNCSRWYEEQPNPQQYSTKPDPCPCTVDQAEIDNRYTWVEPTFPYTECFYTLRAIEQRGRKCCYYKDADRLGALITDLPKGGTIDQYHKLQFPEEHRRHDLQGFKYCCLNSRNRQEMCRKYFKKRPSEGCDAYVPPVQAPVFGDPHVVTLDERNYTFNGLGEYTMIDVKDGFFQLQARTKTAKGGGTATVFSAAVAKEENSSTVQVELKEEGGLEVLIDGQIFQGYSTLTNISVFLNGSLAASRPTSSSFLITFPSGISVIVSEIQGSLSIVFAAPTSFKGHTKGLLGTWNGDKDDDFLKPDGTILPSNATGRQIHFDFGLKWQLLENTTLFTYKPGENTSTFSNASFVPIFLDEPINFASDSLRIAAELACQGDVNCLFDIASTGDVSVGASTKQVSIQIESQSKALQNFPPKILVGPAEVNVTVQTLATITIIAEDPNNDSLSFSVSGTLPAGYTTSSNQTSMTLSWSVTTAKIEIEFVVSDGTASTVLGPVINVCACQNHGVCFQEEANDDSNTNNNTEKFKILSCVCQNGYTGSLCETDLDACEENSQPCFPGVSCIDLPPPANESGYTCGPCPSGYSGDGAECSDVDECSVNKGGCQHNCVNTPGSSVCTCNSGYFLNVDKKTCQDVDECSPVSDCMHICENIPGGYNCKCNQDFKVDPTDAKKCIPTNPCSGNQHGCEHICYQSDGQDKCSCRAGYSLDQDGKKCSDIDECATNQHQCSQGCTNTVGSYTCSCLSTFRLDSNGFTCNDIDECLEFTFKCKDDSQKCINTRGSYKCVCEEGLYWIDNKCQGLNKGEAPPPPPPAPEPRTPSEEERAESVGMDIQGLNISEWNKPKEDAVKQSVAEASNKYCATEQCKSSSSKRKRRSANNLIFTEDQVHILPGYPKQISEVPLVAVLAFYLQSPPGSSFPVIKKNILVSIVNGSLADISSAINATISGVQQLFVDTTTPATTNSTAATKASLEDKDDNKRMLYIIAGVVGGVMLLIFVAIIVAWQCKRKNRHQKIGSEVSLGERHNKMKDMEMRDVQQFNDAGFVNDAYMLSLKKRVEEGSLPGSTLDET